MKMEHFNMSEITPLLRLYEIGNPTSENRFQFTDKFIDAMQETTRTELYPCVTYVIATTLKSYGGFHLFEKLNKREFGMVSLAIFWYLICTEKEFKQSTVTIDKEIEFFRDDPDTEHIYRTMRDEIKKIYK